MLNKNDIEKLVNLFYEKVKTDLTISRFFKADFKWCKHVQNMYTLWENVAFYTANFEGTPMQKYFKIQKKQPLTFKDFHQWIYRLNEIANELFIGDNANLTKKRA